MSQPSPAKHERIQRHLMRQRGAGSRAVHADFGFSFAGFSAPNSQEATPTAAAIEPPAKRRKTIADEAGREDGLDKQKTRGSVLDRREKTKAGRAKRRFVVEVDEEHDGRPGTGSGEGDDSFIAGLGTRKHAKRYAAKKKEAVQDQKEAEYEAAPAPAAKKAGGSKRPRARRKAEESALNEGYDGRDQMLDSEALAIREVQSRSRKGPTRKTKKDAIAHETNDGDEQPRPGQNASGSAAAPKATRTRKAKANREVLPQDSNAEDPDTIAAEPTKQVSTAAETTAPRRTAAAAVDEPAGNRRGKSTNGGAHLPNSSRKGRTPALSNEEDDVEPKAAPPKISRKATTKFKSNNEPVLKSTPPQLKRTPLQEADANRSPSPRKSAGKDASPDGAGAAKDEMAKGKGSKRTCAQNENAVERPRKNRKLRVERDEHVVQIQEAADVLNSGLEPLAKVQIGDVQEAAISAENDKRKAPEQDLSNAKGVAKKEKRTAKPQPEPPQKTSSPSDIEQPRASLTKRQRGDDEEDIDWLFAAPDKTSHASHKAASAKARSTAPRTTKLADIDLDELLANVAAFAQSGDAGSGSRFAGRLPSQKGRTRGRR